MQLNFQILTFGAIVESAAVVEHSLIPKDLLLGSYPIYPPNLKKEGKLKIKGLRLNLIDKRTLVPAYGLLSRPSNKLKLFVGHYESPSIIESG